MPTFLPTTNSPTVTPTVVTTMKPTLRPTRTPTSFPTTAPNVGANNNANIATSDDSHHFSTNENAYLFAYDEFTTVTPTVAPTMKPTLRTGMPTSSPTMLSTSLPTTKPTLVLQPTIHTTSQPTEDAYLFAYYEFTMPTSFLPRFPRLFKTKPTLLTSTQPVAKTISQLQGSLSFCLPKI
jgi:hypothetical protein